MKRNIKRTVAVIVIGAAILVNMGLAAKKLASQGRVYHSVEEAYYAHNLNSEIRCILRGDKCDLVIGEKDDDTYQYEYLLKTEEGWISDQSIHTERIVSEFDGDFAITVYRHLDDHFITIFGTRGGSFEIADSAGTKFLFVSQFKEYMQKEYYLACAYLEEYNENYWLEVDGKKLSFTN